VVDLSKVTLAEIGTLPAGITLNPSGTVTVGAGVVSGPVSFRYSICETGASPDNCDTATVTFDVLNEIVALDNDYGTITAGSTTATVMGNDSLNGIVVNSARISVSAIGTLPSGITFNPDGTVTIDAGVAIGVYIFDYQICESNTTIDNCDTATVTLMIDEATPVNLLYFEVKKSGNIAVLNWATASEKMNRGFEVYHSADATDWNALSFIATIAEGGNSTQQLNYSFDHLQPLNGINYYRLKQIDIDGKYTYTTVRHLAFDNATGIGVYPNPILDYVVVEGLHGDEIINVTDLNGKLVLQQIPGTTASKLDMSNIISGAYYIVIIRTGQIVSTHKIHVIK